MRNLKKFLALVLAFVMAMSLMVTVNAASSDFADSENINEKFEEAVNVLSGMGVFQGTNENGTLEFKPQSSVTRAQMAAVVYRLATGDAEDTRAHLYKEFANFTDVDMDAWYAGYVGFCYDAEIIKGYGDNSFKPSKPVTGYEALAMLLRAVGYGKNGEFEGGSWRVNVGSTATGEGLLVNVNNSTYANTLNETAKREMLAEISFQAAQIPTVTYQYGTYNKYTTTVTVAGSPKEYNPSLGEKFYGLTWDYGIVVANQETRRQDAPGNKTTVLSISTALNAANDEVITTNGSYNSANVTATGNTEATRGSIIANFDVETGLEDFGHLKKVWYNYNGSTHKTYAIYDKSVQSDMVVSSDSNLTSTLGDVAEDMGYVVPAAGAYASQAYSAFYTSFDTSIADTADRGTSLFNSSPSNLYMLISNGKDAATGKPRLDAVVNLNVEASKVIAVNNNVAAADKSVTVGFGDNYQSATQTLPGAGTAIGTEVAPAATAVGRLPILQDALSANSTTTLGDFAIVNALGSISEDTATAYNVAKLAEPKTGKVVSYYNGTDPNTDPDYVVLDDGTKLVKSPLYTVVVNNDGQASDKWSAANTLKATAWDGKSTIIPQAAFDANGADFYNNGTYRFYIAPDGKYVGSEEILSTGLIYGTYMDYTQETSSSTFKYYLTGIDENGQQVTKQVETITTGGATSAIDRTNNAGVLTPYRNSQSNNGMGQGYYNLLTLNGTALSDDLTVPGFAATGDFTAQVTIGKTQKVLGTVLANGTTYFTENTKFILVEGYGTDSAKATVYNGIGELLGDNKEVKINLRATDTVQAWNTAHPGNDLLNGIYPDEGGSGGTKMNRMAFWKTSPFIYDQNHTPTARQADVIFLPKAAVEFSGNSNLYYVGNNTPTLVTANIGEHATQFTMYDSEGNEGKYWVDGWTSDAGSGAATVAGSGVTDADKFYELADSGKKTSDGATIYSVAAHASSYTRGVAANYADNGTIDPHSTGLGAYVAKTQDALNADINGNGTAVPYRVAGAKVVNLAGKGDAATLGTRYPGITDLATLNGSSSVNSAVQVAAIVADDGLTVTTIFVCYNQGHT